MNGLERVVKAIYKEAENGDITTFGAIDTSLPAEWEQFFRKRAQGFRGQQTKEPEPKSEPEKDAEDADILTEILTGIVKRIEAIEARLELIEVAQGLESQEPEAEVVRKGFDDKTFMLRMKLDGLCGALVNRDGRVKNV